MLSDTLKGLGIDNANYVKEASDFWLPRFFSNEYCALDKATSGAARYLQTLASVGAQIVYLTGRDIPRMQKGTIYNLKQNFFPTSSQRAVLLMKPDPQMDDLLFKKQSFANIAKMGDVVGVFENEPANINAMADAFPEAIAVFLDTVHSSKPDVPYQRIFWMKDFQINISKSNYYLNNNEFYLFNMGSYLAN